MTEQSRRVIARRQSRTQHDTPGKSNANLKPKQKTFKNRAAIKKPPVFTGGFFTLFNYMVKPCD
ncbi:hypothetical protein JHL22_06760 [Advenella sp. WQ 585]|uniref:Uncharacterized protein n=1 Tax=Advenella mandrilli TaxID=2800330 RepID=A0ABS1EF17_9BURK|nr:hypothetical protein [Advenella mandrilli]MBK1780911.1 hypothetical protein [Advenella mandrilli]